MSSSLILFNRPSLFGNELIYISEAVESGNISGEGHFSRRCEEQLGNYFVLESMVLRTTSCAHSLERGASLCEVRGASRESALEVRL